MKKSLAWILCFTMILGTTLFGCGGKTEGGNTEGGNTADKKDLSAYEYGEINYDEDLSGYDTALVEKTIGEIDRATLEKAIQQVCFSFYWKNPNTQYDLGTLSYDTIDSKRRTTFQTPEQTDADEMYYAQCAEYAYEVYWEFCNYEFFGDRTHSVNGPGNVQDPAIWKIASDYDETSVANFFNNEVRPGDIFYGGGKQVTGHIIMLVGDSDGDGVNECLHCWPYKGGSLNTVDEPANEGAQKFELEGAIVHETCQELLLDSAAPGGLPNWGIFTNKNDQHWQVYRPFDGEEIKSCHMTTAAASRLAFPDIAITKRFQKSVRHSIYENEDLVFVETIQNNSKQDYKGLNVTEYVPDYTVFKEADANCTVDGRKMKWTLDVPAGQSVEITYTVTNKQVAGEMLYVPSGLVAGIKTRYMNLNVGKTELSDEQTAIFKTIAEKKRLPDGIDLKSCDSIEFVNEFYKQVLGIDVNLPKNYKDLQDALFEERKSIPSSGAAKMLFKKDVTAENEYIAKQIPYNMIGGLFYSTGTYSGAPDWKVDRFIDIQYEFFEPGDVIIGMGGNSKRQLDSPGDLEVYIYLGEEKVLLKMNATVGVGEFNKTAGLFFKNNLFFVLRPTLNN